MIGDAAVYDDGTQILDEGPVFLEVVVAEGGPFDGVVGALGKEADFDFFESPCFYRGQKICEIGLELRREIPAGRIHDRSRIDAPGEIDRDAKAPLAIVVHLLQLGVDGRRRSIVVVDDAVGFPAAGRIQVIPGVVGAAQAGRQLGSSSGRAR